MADLIQVHPTPQSSILFVYSMKDEIDMEPPYQRMGDIWPLSKRQLLIDSILNGYDLPKIYVHQFTKPRVEGDQITRWAMVDGKQRLQAIIDFIENRYALDSSFEYMRDPAIDLGGLTYSEIAKKYPKIKMRLDGFSLPIFAIQTEDIELIEDMFSRLNEAAPLNAAEKRNAFGGPIPKVIRRLSNNQFFTDRVAFTNGRYRHYDVIAKLLLLEYEMQITDTKKMHLDRFVREFKVNETDTDAAAIEERISEVLDRLSTVFVEQDQLLRAVGMVPVYYWLIRTLSEIGKADAFDRTALLEFEERRRNNRYVAEHDEESSSVSFELLEYDRLSQSPNDAHAIRYRLSTLGREILPDDVYHELISAIDAQEFDSSSSRCGIAD